MAIEPEQGTTERILLEGGLVDALQVAAARKRMGRVGGTLPGNLVRMGLVPESRILDILSRRYGVPSLPRERLKSPQPEALSLLSFDQAFLFRALPIRRTNGPGRGALEAAVADPGVTESLRVLPSIAALDLRLFVAPERELERAIEGAYKKKAPPFQPAATAAPATGSDAPEAEPAETVTASAASAAFETVVEPIAPGFEPEIEIELTPNSPAEAAPRDEDPAPVEARSAPAPQEERSTGAERGPSKELVAVRVLIELLEKKGVLTRAEFLSALKQWSEES